MARTRIAVVGLGQFGTTLVKQLCRMDVEVLAIDKDPRKIENIAEVCDDAVVLDIQDEEATRDRLKEVDVLVVAIGETPLPGILLTTIGQELGIRSIIVRAHEPTSRAILMKLGATEVYSPEKKAAESMVRKLTIANAIDSLPLSKDQAIIEIDVPEDWIGLSVKEIEIRKNFALNLICVSKNGGDSYDFSPAIDVPFEDTDKLYLLGSSDRLAQLTGPKG
ncbi:MAG: TrkA family potassium uptake protein [Planctomycetota bacterium]